MKLLKTFKEHPTHSLLLLAGVLSLTPLKLFALIILPIVLATSLKRHAKVSLFSHYVFMWFIMFSLQIIMALLLWVLNIKFSVGFSVVVVAIFVLFTSKYLDNTKITNNKNNIFDRKDAFSLVLSLVIALPIVFSTLSSGKIGLLREASSGFDNSQHITVLLSTYNEDGLLYGNEAATQQKLIFTDRGEYPKGWHIVTAHIWKSIDAGLSFSNDPFKILLFYFLTKIVLVFSSIFMFSRLLLVLADLFKQKQNNNLVTMGLTAGFTGIASLIYFVPNVAYGFAPFLLLNCFVLCGLYAVLSYDEKEQSLRLLLLALLCVAGAFTWLIALFFFGLVFILFSVQYIADNYLKRRLREWFPYLLVVATISALSFIQLYFQLKYSVKPGNINETGGIFPISNLLVIAMTVVSGVWLKSLTKYKIRNAIVFFLVSAGTLSGLVFLYQMGTANTTSYFYTKSLGIYFMLLLLFAASVLTKYITNSTGKSLFSSLSAIFFTGCISLIVLSLSQTSLNGVRYYIGGDRIMSVQTARLAADNMDMIVNNKPYIIILEKPDVYKNVVGTILLNNMTRNHDLCRIIFISDLLTSRPLDGIQSSINDCTKENNVLIINETGVVLVPEL